jgi:hypothetical protein
MPTLTRVGFREEGPAYADFKVKLPEVSPGELEFESVGSYGHSGRASANNE